MKEKLFKLEKKHFKSIGKPEGRTNVSRSCYYFIFKNFNILKFIV